MAEPNGVSINLTDPEIAVVYESFTEDASRIPYGDLLSEFPQEMWPVATQVARLTLEARALLGIDRDREDVLDVSLAAIMAGMLLAEQSISVTTRRSGEPSQTFTFRHFEDQVFLAHEKVAGGIHRFVLLPNRAAFIQAIHETMGLRAPKKAPALRLEDVPAGLIKASIDRTDAGFPEEAAQRLEAALSGPCQQSSLSAFDESDGGRRLTQVLTFLQAEDEVWQISEGGTQPEVVDMTSVDASGLKDLMEPVMAAL